MRKARSLFARAPVAVAAAAAAKCEGTHGKNSATHSRAAAPVQTSTRISAPLGDRTLPLAYRKGTPAHLHGRQLGPSLFVPQHSCRPASLKVSKGKFLFLRHERPKTLRAFSRFLLLIPFLCSRPPPHVAGLLEERQQQQQLALRALVGSGRKQLEKKRLTSFFSLSEKKKQAESSFSPSCFPSPSLPKSAN